MRWLRERRLRRQASAMAAFWRWWASDGATRAAGAVERGSWSSVGPDLAARIKAVGADLDWTSGPGQDARHRLSLVTGPDVALRATAERWRRSAPSRNVVPDWEYAVGGRRGGDLAGARLSIGGADVEFDGLRFAVLHTRNGVVDVSVHHPSFARLTGDARMRIAFLGLELLLGEDEVRRSIGAIETSPQAHSTALDPSGLIAVVEGVTADRSDGWVMVETETARGRRTMLQALMPLDPLEHLPFDRHTQIRARYRASDTGLPESPAELDRLHDLDHRIEAATAGRGIVVCIEASNGVRTTHVYSDGLDQNVLEALEALRRGKHGIRMQHRIDPNWKSVRDARALVLSTPD